MGVLGLDLVIDFRTLAYDSGSKRLERLEGSAAHWVLGLRQGEREGDGGGVRETQKVGHDAVMIGKRETDEAGGGGPEESLNGRGGLRIACVADHDVGIAQEDGRRSEHGMD